MIVFLDIDGVLNSFDFYNNESSIGKELPYSNIDLRCIHRLNNLNNVQFVISSSWRNNYIIDELKTIFKNCGFIHNIIACLDIIDDDIIERGKLIEKYINDNNIQKYIIIDDEIIDSHIDKLFLCDSNFGLTETNLVQIKSLLTNNF